MLLVIPRGLPRTGRAIARRAIIVACVTPAAPPPAVWDFGVIGRDGEMEPWPGPTTPYQFVLRRGGEELHVVYTGPDPKLRYGEEFAVKGHMVGGQFLATEILVLCDWRDRECFVRHPDQLHGRELPAAEPPYYK